MTAISRHVVDLIDVTNDAPSAAAAGRAFFRALEPYGARAIYARSFHADGLMAEQILSRISPPGWENLYAESRFADVNYLTREVRRRADPFAWSDIRLITAAERELAQALADNGFPDGLAVPSHGPGYFGVTSLAFERLEAIDPEIRQAIELASLVTHARMRRMAPQPVGVARLSPRERDCIGFISGGLSDAEIADRLGVATTTIITHVQAAKRKLGAKTRAQAVALALFADIL